MIRVIPFALLFISSGGNQPLVNVGGVGTAATSIGAFGSTPNANGLSLSSNVLTQQPADGTHPGGVSITTQTLAGKKTFSSGVIITGDDGGGANQLIMNNAAGTSRLQFLNAFSGTASIDMAQNGAFSYLMQHGQQTHFADRNGGNDYQLFDTNNSLSVFGLTKTAITAHSGGGGSGSATALPCDICQVTTVGANGDSVILGTCTLGRDVAVLNDANTSHSIAVFPTSGGAIDALGTDTSFSLSGASTPTMKHFQCVDSAAKAWVSH